jgi:Tfp pilus assembly protein PilN
MIKINLLPARVVETRKVRSLLKLLILVVLLEAAGLSFAVFSLMQKEKALQTQYNDAHARAEEVRALEQQATAAAAAIVPVKTKLDWYDGIYKHNAKIADSLARINEYIFAKLTVRRLQLNGTSVAISGATRDIDYVAKAYFNLLRSPYISAGSVRMNPSGSGSARGGGGRGAAAARGPRGGPPGGMMGRMSGGGRARTPGSRTAAATGSNPNEAMAVQFTFALLPQYNIAVAGEPTSRAASPRGTGGRGGGGGGRGGRRGPPPRFGGGG